MARKSSDYIQMTLDHGIDIPGRTIYLTSYSDAAGEEAGVDWQLADRVIRGLRILGSGEVPIKLVINNFGGEDDHTRAIIEAIVHCPSEVHGEVYGRAESAAAWILQHCDHRSIGSRSNLMLHMGSGTKDAHSQYVDRMFTTDILNRLQQKDPTYSKSKLMRLLHSDWYVYATQALELGLVDEVLG